MTKVSHLDASKAPAMTTSFKIAIVAVTTIALMMAAVLVALVVVVIVFSGDIADLNSRFNSVPQISNVVAGSNTTAQVGTSVPATQGGTSAPATQGPTTSGSFEALLQQEISALTAVVDQLNSSLLMQVSNVQAQTNDIVAGLEQTGIAAAFPGTSCASINSSLSSGNYWLRSSAGNPVNVYCNMDLSCDNVTGWMRVADLDFTNRNDSCPANFMERTLSGVRFCEQTSGTGCSQADFSTFDIPYSKVCGKATGYQFGTPEAFSRLIVISSLTLSSQYLDGFSLTRGSLMEHIWSFPAGVTTTRDDRFGCPCVTMSSVSMNIMNSFIGSDYFCDSVATSISSGTFYPNNVLWDNVDCSVTGCCNFNSPPFFYKELTSSTGPIEFRACRDEVSSSEGVYVGSIELYVQ